ncbi:Ktr system potassium transporter B [Robertmurraya yapensis]|uniref:Ktr system potassium transporter B n=1 Tax=Bacillus yapensis TaxID=2492960 RepID=A0A3S0KQU4_9BACI|nr:TrkH family potassium uptake protein [Bacillus yapensis]RTR36171.1 Ktr system potassium transporter B [Bacillus yapensis]TKT05674.1 Ktr system potassium transporter B [Bacillus yapensis]
MDYRKVNLSPSQLLIVIFFVSILIGTGLLMLPFATTEPIHFIDALFTATSAMTVTGLAVVDTGSVYTVFGQVIIVSLIQLGGLGIMSFAVLIYMALGKKIGLKDRILLQQSLNQTSIGGVIYLVRNLFIFSLAIEGIAMLFLALRWVPNLGWGKGLFYSFFHSISAFNNAGMALWPDNLMGFVGDPIVNIVISLLFITGGLGFTVLIELWREKSFKKMSLHSRLMLVGTFVINIVSMLLIFVLEYSNPNTLGGLASLWDKLWASYFQAVSPRTAGFNTLDIASLDESTIFLMLLLMFVGAGSASTGGGIKLTTFLVIVLAVVTYLRGKKEVVVGRRSISYEIVFRSLAISSIALAFIFVAVFLLNITEKEPFLPLLFEVISAFGTVGLSMGITAKLTVLGKLLIIFMMFLGKLGPLTLVMSLAKQDNTKIRYPSENILTG